MFHTHVSGPPFTSFSLFLVAFQVHVRPHVWNILCQNTCFRSQVRNCCLPRFSLTCQKARQWCTILHIPIILPNIPIIKTQGHSAGRNEQTRSSPKSRRSAVAIGHWQCSICCLRPRGHGTHPSITQPTVCKGDGLWGGGLEEKSA